MHGCSRSIDKRLLKEKPLCCFQLYPVYTSEKETLLPASLLLSLFLSPSLWLCVYPWFTWSRTKELLAYTQFLNPIVSQELCRLLHLCMKEYISIERVNVWRKFSVEAPIFQSNISFALDFMYRPIPKALRTVVVADILRLRKLFTVLFYTLLSEKST